MKTWTSKSHTTYCQRLNKAPVGSPSKNRWFSISRPSTQKSLVKGERFICSVLSLWAGLLRWKWGDGHEIKILWPFLEINLAKLKFPAGLLDWLICQNRYCLPSDKVTHNMEKPTFAAAAPQFCIYFTSIPLFWSDEEENWAWKHGHQGLTRNIASFSTRLPWEPF